MVRLVWVAFIVEEHGHQFEVRQHGLLAVNKSTAVCAAMRTVAPGLQKPAMGMGIMMSMDFLVVVAAIVLCNTFAAPNLLQVISPPVRPTPSEQAFLFTISCGANKASSVRSTGLVGDIGHTLGQHPAR